MAGLADRLWLGLRRVGVLRRLRGAWHLRGACRDGGPQGRVRGQHSVVAVTVLARGRHQRGDAVDELQGVEHELGAPVRAWLGEAVDPQVIGEGLQALEGEGRAQ